MAENSPVFTFDELIRVHVALEKDIETMQRFADEEDNQSVTDPFWSSRIEEALTARSKVNQMLSVYRN